MQPIPVTATVNDCTMELVAAEIDNAPCGFVTDTSAGAPCALVSRATDCSGSGNAINAVDPVTSSTGAAFRSSGAGGAGCGVGGADGGAGGACTTGVTVDGAAVILTLSLAVRLFLRLSVTVTLNVNDPALRYACA